MKTDIYITDIRRLSSNAEQLCRDMFPQRFERAARFRRKEDCLRSYGVAFLLYEVLHLEEKDIRFGEKGKPFCPDSAHFSITHSGDYVALGVSETLIGVDIEAVKDKHLTVKNRFFTPEERQWIEENPLDRFYALWTVKESLSKAVGVGLSLPFPEINALPLLNNAPLMYDNNLFFGADISFDGYGFSVVTQGQKPEITQHTVTA